MICLICDGPAEGVDAGGDYQERTCPKCGHYRITGTAIALLETHGWRFDVELSRMWLAHQQASGFIPTIDSQQVSRLIDA